LPPGIFVPGKDRHLSFANEMRAFNEQSLIRNQHISNRKRKLLREVELVVIDEVSMLRADLLDAIDCVLRMVRRNSFPFGGADMLFIGDLGQLPPVVRDNEWNILKILQQSVLLRCSSASGLSSCTHRIRARIPTIRRTFYCTAEQLGATTP
jgi:hypothetical protein